MDLLKYKAVATHDFDWKIYNFITENVEDIEDCSFFSENIEIELGENNTKWKMELIIKNHEVNIMLNKIRSDSNAFRVRFSGMIKSKNGVDESSDYFEEPAIYFERSTIGLIFFTHESYEELFKFVKDDVLVIYLKVELFEANHQLNPERFPCSDRRLNIYYKKFKDFFDMNAFFDFKLICSDGMEIPVHRSILAVNSPVFRTMFEASMQESENHVAHIDDLNGKVMKEIVNFMYTGIVDLLNNHEELLYGAVKYQLVKLKELVMFNIVEHFDYSNVFSFFFMADLYDEKYLMLRCVVYIQSNYDQLKDHEDWEKLNSRQWKIITGYFQQYVKRLQVFTSKLPDT